MKKEGIKQIQMKEFYLKLGSKRSYRAVALAFGVSVPTVSGYAALFHWDNYVAKSEMEKVADAAEKDANIGITKYKQYLTIIDRAINLFACKLNNNEIPLTSTLDLGRLVKMSILLNGALNEEHKRRIQALATKEQLETTERSAQTLDTVTKIMAEANRFGGLDKVSAAQAGLNNEIIDAEVTEVDKELEEAQRALTNLQGLISEGGADNDIIANPLIPSQEGLPVRESDAT